ERFCRNELTGWYSNRQGERDESISYREIAAFLSPFGELNSMYMGWGNDFSSAMDYMRNDKKNFFPYTLVVPYPVAKLEADLSGHSPKSILSVRLRQGDVLRGTKTPDTDVIAYARGDCYITIIEGIRRELTRHLLALLPQAILE